MTLRRGESMKKARPGRGPVIVFLSIGLLGCFLLFISVKITINNISLTFFGKEVEGFVVRQETRMEDVVVGYDKGKERKAKRRCYYAIVAFETERERTVEFKSMGAGVEKALYPTESAVTVRYLPAHPENARIASEISWLFGPLLTAFIGAACIGVALLAIFFSAREWPPPTGSRSHRRDRTGRISSGIRRAVGAIVTCQENYLLVHTVQSMDDPSAPGTISSGWNPPIGELLHPDEPPRTGLLQILREKTGSQFYTILREFEESVVVGRTRDRSPSSSGWETRMYLVEYTGDGADLTPLDKEIDQVRLFTSKGALERISCEGTKSFFEKYLSTRGVDDIG